MSAAIKPLWQRFLIFLVPLMLSNILQSLSGTINNIYVGQLLGVEALAAVSIFFPIMIFMISFLVGLASGASILIGQAWGAKNLEKIRQINGTTLAVALIGGIVVAVLGALFARQLMELLGAPENILVLATDYARIMFIGMPGFFIFLIITSMLRGVGDTVTPLIALTLSIVGGLVVTPGLILGWFGLPPLGIAAAAIAFIIGFTVVLLFLFFYLNWRKSPLAPDLALLRRLTIDFGLLKVILRLGIPAGVAMVVSSVAAIVVVGIVNGFGSDATAAYGAVNQVLSYVQFPAMSIGIASAIFAAQAIGARQMAEVEHITRTGMIVNLCVTGGFVLLAYLFSEHLVRLFITSEEVIELTETLLHIVLWSVVMSGFAQVLSAVMRASGDVLVPMLLSLLAIVTVELPLAIILSQTIGLHGVWIAYAVSFSTMLVLQAAYYWLFWRKKEIKALI
jgi:putative MATE family efflux protein